ncbi:regulator of nitric oxide reductase transcription [Thiobacillus denitrificans ATCC 25259]|uniref:Regulator of nitric oxide reductase transcription n=1 Tax=Thiobacillus denitrificans (strain ATCC 25259 / T1) TaxID=292415 RepID=Q3SML4_THIDA|nr:NosR/NirI family protein [Thiobacillus denitrificans]AAZ96031.1 regulator of nitric oxide reductase transcription [Thiobacillus denitrificans ATCC 25259]
MSYPHLASAASRPASRVARLRPGAVWSLLIAFMLLFGTIPNAAADLSARYPQVRALFPDADRFGESEGDPPASAVYADNVLVGYALLTADIAPIPAYSGSPINVLVGIDTGGRIVGARIVHHEEPILAAGISEARLARFVDQYRGKPTNGRISVGAAREGYAAVDTISGATISVMVINASITRAVRRVAESRGIAVQAAPTIPPATAPLAAALPAAVPAEAQRSREPPASRSTPGPSVPAAVDKAPAANPSVAPAAAPPPATREAAPAATPRLAAPSPPEASFAEEPMWQTVWRQRKLDIALLGLGLVVLTCILLFQDYLARRPALLRWVRLGFLVYTLGFIGWYALGQLSIINVLTFVQAITHQFSWDTFLIDPMLFILWSFVAVTLLLWGRGVYCGWLCPFGALQELSFRLARRLRLPSFEIPHVVHERMLALKFVILLVLFALSLQSMGLAIRVAEVEPFKTAINFRFQREWGYVAFAVAVLLLSTFNRKFYCKYVCPLGASLVFPGRFHSFEWLRRRKECGRPCQACAVECEVQAIRPTGEIVVNECHHCLDCQVTYYNDHKCPPLVEKRKRHERSSAREASGPGAAELARIAVSARPARGAASANAEKPQAVDGNRVPLT